MSAAGVFLAADGRVRAGWRFFLFIPLFVFLAMVLFRVAVLLPGAEQWEQTIEYAAPIGGAVTTAAALLASAILLRWVDRRRFRTLGLWFYAGWAREFALGLGGGVALLSVAVGALWLGGWVEFAGVELDARGAAAGAALYVLVFLPPTLFEELVFRGYPFQRLLEAAGAFAAVLALSALFGFLHTQNPGATPVSTANTALMGIVLALCYLKTRGLWLPLGVHFAWNYAMGFVYSLPVSGFTLSGRLLEVRVTGPAWLSGGNYGPEGSVVVTGAALAAALWLAATRRIGVSEAMAQELE